MPQYACIFITLLLIFGTTIEAAKILVLHTFPSKSHINAYQPLYEELARRGHEVTLVSAFPKKTKLANYNEIVLEDTFPPRDSKDLNFFDMGKVPFFIIIFFMKNMVIDSCEKVLLQPNMQNLIHSTDLEFDLIIYESFMTQCTYGLLHKFKAPYIQVVPNTLMEWMSDTMGNPRTTSYIPNAHGGNQNMDFLSRASNFIMENYMILFSRFVMEPAMDSIMRKHFPDPSIPTIPELESNVSFLFLHSHPILNHPRPLTPNTIEVAGLHIKSTQGLPKELKTFLDDAPHGVIYFSLGSNVRGVDMPEEMRNAILKSFSKLKQKILWKWEADSLPGQPKNVRLSKWLPQHDVLAHPNVKLFITHGGLMSLQEATYFGVPLIAIPVGADQNINANLAQNRGFGVVLNIRNITEESLDWALHEVMQESRYRDAINEASRIFQDQPQKPMDRAVYWIEYTIRHKGAAHLRSAALRLNIFQFYLLDVIAVLFLVLLSLITIIVFTGRVLIRRLCSGSTKYSRSIATEKKKKS